MRFGPVPLDQAEGAIAAHSVRHAAGTIKKGTRLAREHIGLLRQEGVAEIVAARLDPADAGEDEAAAAVAELLCSDNIRVDQAFTGRCNLYAKEAGLFRVDGAVIDAVNRIDSGLTVATLPDYAPVETGRMVATVKVIPFALPRSAIAAAARTAHPGALKVLLWRPLRVGLAATVLPGLKPSVMDKTRRILEERLRPAGASLIGEERVPHAAAPLAAAIASLQARAAELIVVFGASAIADAADVIPEALRRAGGRAVHFGMPVDPGNLLLVGDLNGTPVLGAPGCARSPAENGFDWVLQRFLAGIEVTPDDITGMGVGGLLMEIVSRPQPREPGHAKGPVAAIVLAAGQGRRMGGPNKLLARFEGKPLVRRVAEQALASQARPVLVVTGHRAEEIASALAGLDVKFIHNPDFAEGLATSLKAGLAQLPREAAGALVVLADMPGVTTAVVDRLIETFRSRDGPTIVLPTAGGKRGNPVLWSRDFFPELARISGDTGARHLLGAHADAVQTIEVGAAAAIDVDTPEALKAAGGELDPA